MPGDMHLVSQAEIARRLAVSRSLVSRWARTVPSGFPRPVARAARLAFWDWDEVARWARVKLEFRDEAGPPLDADSSGGAPHVQQQDRLIGRSVLLDQLLVALRTSRVIVLTGPVGVGKTRLARELGDRAAQRFADGVRMVELAEINDPGLVPHAVALALALTEQVHRPLRETLAHALRDRRLLLLLDNCERLAPACTELAAELSQRCPGLSLVATSQVVLPVPGAVNVTVEPLPVPEADADLDTVTSSPSVALFCSRAASVHRGFSPSGDALRAAAEVCRHLDGLPLAIELAAARVAVLTPRQLAERLDRRMLILTGGGADAPARHQTLRLALDWSHDLLSAHEQVLLRRLSVFVGDCDVEAVDAVCGQEPGDWNVLDPLAGLVAKSLLHVDASGDRATYRMLESVRLYAADRLADSGETAAIRRRHAAWFLRVATEAEPRLTGPEQLTALAALDTARNDLRAALTWALDECQAELALRISGALVMYWRLRGSFREGKDALTAAFALDGDQSVQLRAKALWGCGWMKLMLFEGDSRAILETSLLLARRAGGREAEARSLLLLGNAQYLEGNYLIAMESLRRSYEVAGEAADPWCAGHALGMMARLYVDDGSEDSARRAAEACIKVARRAHDSQSLRVGLFVLAEVDVSQGRYEAARVLIDEALGLGHALSESYLLAGCLHLLGDLAAGRGDHAAGIELLRQALDLDRQDGDPIRIAVRLLALGRATTAIGDLANAGMLIDDAAAAMSQTEAAWAPGLLATAELEAARGHASEAQRLIADAMATGRVPSPRRSVAAAMGAVGRSLRDRGELQLASALHCRALELCRDGGQAPGVADALEDLGGLRAACGRPEQAARILGGANRIREDHGFARAPIVEARYVSVLSGVREALGDERFDAAWREGRALPLSEAVTYALRGWGPRLHGAEGWESLTKTELDVIALVREGLTSRQIADRLFVSRRTVEAHLTHIYSKVGVRSRGRLVAVAAHRDAGARTA